MFAHFTRCLQHSIKLLFINSWIWSNFPLNILVLLFKVRWNAAVSSTASRATFNFTEGRAQIASLLHPSVWPTQKKMRRKETINVIAFCHCNLVRKFFYWKKKSGFKFTIKRKHEFFTGSRKLFANANAKVEKPTFYIGASTSLFVYISEKRCYSLCYLLNWPTFKIVYLPVAIQCGNGMKNLCFQVFSRRIINWQVRSGTQSWQGHVRTEPKVDSQRQNQNRKLTVPCQNRNPKLTLTTNRHGLTPA